MIAGIQLVMGAIMGWMLAEELKERSEHHEEHHSSGKILPCASGAE